MSPSSPRGGSGGAVDLAVSRTAALLGSAIREHRARRGWTMRQLAHRAHVSFAAVQRIESGRRGSLEMYVRLAHALDRQLAIEVIDPRLRGRPTRREADLVHAAMGEFEAAHLRGLGVTVSLDEPYQHFQFAGRADLLAWSIEARALLHVENRTRFPDLQEAAGSWNAKRAYLAPVIAERIGLRRGFSSVTHVMVGLWSSEVIHSVRLRNATFRSLCPDAASAFDAWWAGHPPTSGSSATFVLLDPFARERQRQWVDLETAITRAGPRVRGYAEAALRLV